MKNWIFILIGAAISAIPVFAQANMPEICITQPQAAAKILDSMQHLRHEVYKETGVSIPRRTIREMAPLISWHSGYHKYVTGIVYKWTCAAGADCYIALSVDCNNVSGLERFSD